MSNMLMFVDSSPSKQSSHPSDGSQIKITRYDPQDPPSWLEIRR